MRYQNDAQNTNRDQSRQVPEFRLFGLVDKILNSRSGSIEILLAVFLFPPKKEHQELSEYLNSQHPVKRCNQRRIFYGVILIWQKPMRRKTKTNQGKNTRGKEIDETSKQEVNKPIEILARAGH